MQRFLRWKVGNVTVTRVQEIEAPQLRFLLREARPENLRMIEWLGPFLAGNGDALASIHALVLEAGDRRILVDTCVGNDKPRPIPIWNMRKGSFLEDLTAAGFPPETIDTVVCTHLHVDHVGWNTHLVDGRWAPTFPNARHIIARREWEHWDAETDELAVQVLADSVRPIFDADLVELVSMDDEVADCVRLEPTPGHTPGHVAVHIESAGEHAVITGDLMHHPCQIAHPEWTATVDTDKELARRTRREFLERHADRPVLVIGTHFAGPTAGRIVRDGERYRLVT